MGLFDRLVNPFRTAGEFLAGERDLEGLLDPLNLAGREEEDEDLDLPDPAEEPDVAPLDVRRRSLARKGRSSTFRTGGQGVLQTASLQKPTLFREG